MTKLEEVSHKMLALLRPRVSSRVSGFPVASPCLWGNCKTSPFSKVSKQVVMSFCVAGQHFVTFQLVLYRVEISFVWLATTHSTLYTRHFTLHTLHSTLHTPHSTLHTPHSTLHTPRSTTIYTLHTPRSSLHTLHSTLYTLHLYTPHFTFCTPHCLHTLHFTFLTPHSTLYTLHSTHVR